MLLNIKKQEKLNTLEQIEDFYNFFYSFKFPVYLHKEYWDNNKKRYKTTNYYINSTKDIIREINSFHANIYISVCDKIPMYTKLKTAKNTQENSRATNYFVVDIDSNYIISRSLIEKLTFYLYNNNVNMPLPTAVIGSGSGIHLYYKFAELDIYKSKNKEYFIKLYKTAINTTKQAINKELENIKKLKPGYFTEQDLFKIKSLFIDTALEGSPSQLIRLVESYNKEAGEYSKIIDFNKNNTYTLGELIQEYNPKYSTLEASKNFKILSEKEFKEKNKIIKLHTKGYAAKDVIALNNNRLESIKKLIKIRQTEGTLVGTRQKIMCQVAWCLINNIDNGAEINILEELLNYGKLIGGEFATKKFCKEKIKHIEEYHKKRNKLSNNTISKWLEIKEEEGRQLPGLWSPEKAKRKIKRQQKKERIEAIRRDYRRGQRIKEISKKYEVSRPTIYKYIADLKKEKGTTLNRDKNFTLLQNQQEQKKLLKAKKDSDQLREEVFKMLVNGQTVKEIANIFGVSKSTIYRKIKKESVKKIE